MYIYIYNYRVNRAGVYTERRASQSKVNPWRGGGQAWAVAPRDHAVPCTDTVRRLSRALWAPPGSRESKNDNQRE